MSTSTPKVPSLEAFLEQPNTTYNQLDRFLKDAAGVAATLAERAIASDPALLNIVEDGLRGVLTTFGSIIAKSLDIAVAKEQQYSGHPVYNPLSTLLSRAINGDTHTAIKLLRSRDKGVSELLILRGRGLIHRALREQGEFRAELAMLAGRRVFESAYRPYLVTVCRLFALTRGRRRQISGPDTDFLTYLDKVMVRHTHVLDKRLILIRNASAHDHWTYDDRGDTIEMWDDKRPRETHTVDSILDALESALHVCREVFPALAHVRVVRATHPQREAVSALIPDLVGPNSQDANAAAELITEALSKQTPSSRMCVRLHGHHTD